MEVNLVVEGLKFMVLGMGIVFVFLALMILAMNAMSKIIHRYFPEPQAAAPEASAPVTTAAPDADKLKKVAAIAAAIHHHNKK